MDQKLEIGFVESVISYLVDFLSVHFVMIHFFLLMAQCKCRECCYSGTSEYQTHWDQSF